MQLHQVTVAGTIQADGTLALDEKLSLPVGRVRVTVQISQDLPNPNGARLMTTMEQIWADQNAREHVPRSKEEIDAAIAVMQEEANAEMQAVERVHHDCQSARQHPGEQRQP